MVKTARPRKSKTKAKTAKRSKAKSRAPHKTKLATKSKLAKKPKIAKPAARKSAPSKSSKSSKSSKPIPRKPAKPVKLTPRKQPKKALSEREIARRRKVRRDAARDARFAAEAEAERKRARRRELYKQKQDRARGKIDEREVAIGWLEHMRDDMSQVFSVSLDMTEAGGGHAELGGRDAAVAKGAPWLVVGRFEPQEEIDYATLAEGFQVVYDDLPLAVAVGEQRLTQIRVVFHDPNAKRTEGDSVLSKIGAYEFVFSEMIRELIGGAGIDSEHPDDESLAARYRETTVPTFYVFLSSLTTSYRNVSPSARTMTFQLR